MSVFAWGSHGVFFFYVPVLSTMPVTWQDLSGMSHYFMNFNAHSFSKPKTEGKNLM